MLFSLRTLMAVMLLGCAFNALSLAAMSFYAQLGSTAWVVAPLCVPGSLLCLLAWRGPCAWLARIGLLGGAWAALCLPTFFM